jgi:hypothetical protein
MARTCTFVGYAQGFVTRYCVSVKRGMKQLLIVFGLLTAGAMGQKNLGNQKACHDQSVKVAKENHVTDFRNRYDPNTNTCWLELRFPTEPGKDENLITVGDAFQAQSKAIFTGPQVTNRTALHECSVDGVRCKNILEFFDLVKEHYGL